MPENLQTQVDTHLSRLDGLIRRGRQVHDTLVAHPSNPSAIAATRVWQQDCGVTINQLSGGSKAHWLARSFSEAFLMRSAAGHAVEGAAPAQIVQRLLDVLEQAVASLSRMKDGQAVSAPSETAPPRRLDRKSTRLNSSHVEISYAVFCLKKKKKKKKIIETNK